MSRACHLRIEGRVQGVGFRDACVRQARALGLGGWVRNRRDGSVEVWAEGPPQAVAELQVWLHRGPTMARVDRVQAVVEDAAAATGGPKATHGFECRETI